MSFYEKTIGELNSLLKNISDKSKELEENSRQAENLMNRKLGLLESQKADLNKLVAERQKGFPWLCKGISDLLSLQDNLIAYQLKLKSRPAHKAAQVVSELKMVIRDLRNKNKSLEYIINYYESVAPFLIELREEDVLDEINFDFEPYTEEETEDEVTGYLAINEYRNLGTVERNQLALERYWNRKHSKLEIGLMYERYIGYLYESDGYDVEYFGIEQGKNDLGRDLICYKGNEIILVQCKNWSKFKTIYENSIFQFFGTIFQMKQSNKNKSVTGHFYATTSVSNLARAFANELGIKLYENFQFNKKYPCVKCIDSPRRKTKIYHLPFDQQYDHIKMNIDDKHRYCETVQKAEELGFRRAFKYRGKKK